MVAFAVGKPITTDVSSIDVDGVLPIGSHRFQLVVEDATGVRSQPDQIVVAVRGRVVLPPTGPVVIDPTRPPIVVGPVVRPPIGGPVVDPARPPVTGPLVTPVIVRDVLPQPSPSKPSPAPKPTTDKSKRKKP